MKLLDELFSQDDAPANYADLDTMFGRVQVYDMEGEDGETLRILDVADTWQSASYVGEGWAELAFGYHQHFARAFAVPFELRRTLVLGGGGFSFPKWILAHHPLTSVDVVEVDPAIVEVAQEWFFLDKLSVGQRARLRTVVDDARGYLSSFAAIPGIPHYQLVVNDLFAAEEPDRELMGVDGARLIKGVLEPEGIYVANVVSALKGRRAKPLETVVDALETVFEQVEVVSMGEDEPRVADNNVVFATSGDYSLGGVLTSS